MSTELPPPQICTCFTLCNFYTETLAPGGLHWRVCKIRSPDLCCCSCLGLCVCVCVCRGGEGGLTAKATKRVNFCIALCCCLLCVCVCVLLLLLLLLLLCVRVFCCCFCFLFCFSGVFLRAFKLLTLIMTNMGYIYFVYQWPWPRLVFKVSDAGKVELIFFFFFLDIFLIIDLPCFPFRAAVVVRLFIRLKSLFAAPFKLCVS